MNAPVKNTQRTIHNKLSRKMTLQACLIAVLAILSIGSASLVLEQFLVRQALISEAEHYWNAYAKDANFKPPSTANLKGFMTEVGNEENLPVELTGFPLGFNKMHGQLAHSLLYSSERYEKKLYLLFDGKSVTRLALFFGIFPLVVVLILIYSVTWWVYRESNYLLSPIVWLANKFDRFDPAQDASSLEDLSDIPGDVDWEVEKLVGSFSSYSRRIKSFVDRERAFTRDASHEFRTPLTVIKMASDLLLAEQELDEHTKKYITRIKGSARDMEELIDAFLILARETDQEFEEQYIRVVESVEREVKIADVYLEDKPIVVQINQQYPLELFTANKVLSIVLGNLIRNAILYTKEGTVTIIIKENSVVIADTGVGMTTEQIKKIFQPYYRVDQEHKSKRRGYGVGLTIVNRLSNRFNWRVEVRSEVGVGSEFEVIFKDTNSS